MRRRPARRRLVATARRVRAAGRPAVDPLDAPLVVSGLRVSIDGQTVDPSDLKVLLGHGPVDPADLVRDVGRWWYLQDRLVLSGPQRLGSGEHRATVDFRLLVPYLSAGPDAPLVLPQHLEASLDPDVHVRPDVARDVA